MYLEIPIERVQISDNSLANICIPESLLHCHWVDPNILLVFRTTCQLTQSTNVSFQNRQVNKWRDGRIDRLTTGPTEKRQMD